MGIGADLGEFFYTLNANQTPSGYTPKSLGDFVENTNHEELGEVVAPTQEITFT